MLATSDGVKDLAGQGCLDSRISRCGAARERMRGRFARRTETRIGFTDRRLCDRDEKLNFFHVPAFCEGHPMKIHGIRPRKPLNSPAVTRRREHVIAAAHDVYSNAASTMEYSPSQSVGRR
jgi:hypothetical protein